MSILNEEDIPHMLLTTLHFNQQHEKTVQEILLAVQNVVNDDGVRDIDRHVRKCIFPDEKFLRTTYKYYSYTVCVTECLKRYQLVLCKCTHFNLINGGMISLFIIQALIIIANTISFAYMMLTLL